MSAVLGVAVGAATGILSGLGIGGGTLLVLYLTFLTGASQTAAQGINLWYFAAAAPPALYSHFRNRYIKITPALLGAGAGVITSAAAAYFASAVAEASLLRRLFGGLLLVIGVVEFFAKEEKQGG